MEYGNNQAINLLFYFSCALRKFVSVNDLNDYVFLATKSVSKRREFARKTTSPEQEQNICLSLLLSGNIPLFGSYFNRKSFHPYLGETPSNVWYCLTADFLFLFIFISHWVMGDG